MKRAEDFLSLVQRFPGLPFKMLLFPGRDPNYTRMLYQQAGQLANLRLWKGVPYRETEEHFRDCAFLVSTSRHEGFPNVFLQAWSQGRAVVSVEINPDGVLARRGCGAVVAGPEDLVAAVSALEKDPGVAGEWGRHGYDYVREKHGMEKVLPRFREILGKLLGDPAT